MTSSDQASRETMRAVVIDDFGGPGRFRVAEVHRPAPSAGQVLVHVEATSVNPADYKIRSGDAEALAPDFPATLHMDVAGVVEAVGEGVEDFQEGDAVFGCAGGLKGPAGNLPGALADYMTCDARLLAPKPESLSFAEASALPLVSLTAWEGLVWKASLAPGQRVLVYGGTGGVGHVALQLAKARGAEVFATGSTGEKRELARSLGASGVANYREETPEEYVERLTGGAGFDVVFDTIGGEHLSIAFEAARPNGAVVTTVAMGTSVDLTPMHEKGLSLHVVFMLLPMLLGEGRERHGAILREVSRLAEDDALRPLVDERRFTFEEASEAHAYAESGDQIGKVVLTRSDI